MLKYNFRHLVVIVNNSPNIYYQGSSHCGQRLKVIFSLEIPQIKINQSCFDTWKQYSVRPLFLQTKTYEMLT